MSNSAARRSTLASVDANSAIPIPSSVVKPSRGYAAASTRSYGEASRLGTMAPRGSLAPAAFARQSQADMAGPSTPHAARRLEGGSQSFAGRQSVAARQSVAPTPNPGRRSMGRASMAPGVASIKPRTDERPLRNKAYMDPLRERVWSYLTKTGFNGGPTFQNVPHLATTTQVMAMNALRHIYRNSTGEDFAFTTDPKKEAEEIMQLLTELKYPLVHDLSRTKLSAAGSAQNWGTVLGVLDWMVQSTTCFDEESGYMGAGALARDIGENAIDDGELFHPFLWKSYDSFWAGQDTYPEEIAELDNIFAKRNACVTKEVEELEDEQAKLTEQMREFTEHETPLQRETSERTVLQSDINKFIKYRVDVLLPKLAKSKVAVQRITQAISEQRDKIKETEAQRDELQRQVSQQPMSSDDFERLQADQERLKHDLSDVAERAKTASQTSWQAEVALGRQQVAIEAIFKEFNPLANRLGLFPLTMSDGSELHELEIVMRNQATMLPDGVEIKGLIRPCIDELRQDQTARFLALSDERSRAQEKLEEYEEALTTVIEDLRARDKEYYRVKERSEAKQQLSNDEHRALLEDQERDEIELYKLQDGSRRAVQQAESRLKSLQMQLECAKDNDRAYRRNLANEAEAAANELVSLKEKTLATIAYLEDAAARACRED